MNATHRPLALVTGASSGIGLMYATELARQGNDLVIVSNQEKELQETSDKLTADFGVTVTPLYRNLATPQAAEELPEDQLFEHLLSIGRERRAASQRLAAIREGLPAIGRCLDSLL